MKTILAIILVLSFAGSTLSYAKGGSHGHGGHHSGSSHGWHKKNQS